MGKRVPELAIAFYVCFILLCVLNFLFRSLFSWFNLVIIALITIFLVVFRNKILIVVRKISALKVQFVFFAATLIGTISLFLFNPVLFDDPLELQNQALIDLQRGFVSLSNPYSQRNLFYLIPIYRLLGTDPIVIQIANFLIYIITGFLFYKILRLNFPDNKIVQNAGIIFFFTIPYFYLALNIPHYDLVSSLYLMLSLWLLSLILRGIQNREKRIYSIFGLSTALGFTYVILFYTRGLTIVMIITSLLFGFSVLLLQAYKWDEKLKVVSFIVLFPFLIYFSTDSILRRTEFIDNSANDRSFSNR